jgi:hypothetical protein
MAEQAFVKPEEIQRLRELEAKATPAPWVWAPGVSPDDEGQLGYIRSEYGKEVCHFGVREMYDNAPGTEPSPEDRELITAARNLLPSLLQEREALRETLATETAAYESMKKAYEIVTGQREEMQKRIKHLESISPLFAVLFDDRLLELALMGTGAYLIRITRGDGSRYGAEWPTKTEALLWARRMFDQWDAGEGGKPDGD